MDKLIKVVGVIIKNTAPRKSAADKYLETFQVAMDGYFIKKEQLEDVIAEGVENGRDENMSFDRAIKIVLKDLGVE